MDTRTLGYLGLGVLGVIVVATLIGVPPAIWISAMLAAVAVAVAVVVRQAQSDGVDDAARMMAVETSGPAATSEPLPAAPARPSSIQMELVRPADHKSGAPAVWLHRRGGRRVHRLETAEGWVVEQVSTKDPDNPKKRVIGETLTFAGEAEAISAADELAQGQAPAPSFLERPNLAAARA